MTWIGHASFLCQLGGESVLVDPVFAERVGWIYRRYGRPGLEPAQLPPLTAALVSHNHYDHLDLASLRSLPVGVPVIVPTGLAGYLRRRLRQPVVELSWWQATRCGALDIYLVPARHWSRRRILDTNRSWWGGFVIAAGETRIYHAGDTAWFEGFRSIGRRCGPLLAALLPIGGYRPGWFMEHHHLNPEQAVRAFQRLGAEWLVPMHWGALQLTDEPLCEPVERLRRSWQAVTSDGGGSRRLAIPAVGETIVLEKAVAGDG